MLKTSSKLAASQKIFLAELAGTFLIVVFATGSVVIDARAGGSLGTPFAAAAPAVAVSLMVRAFGRISMAHFNPAVTVGFFITKHVKASQLPVYFAAEIAGALLASLFVKNVIGTEANLGANVPNYSFPLSLIFGIEVLATGLLMAVIYAAVFTKGLKGFGPYAIGSVVGLDILFLSFISGASMNPARSLAPALLSGVVGDLWLYWSATFVGTFIVAVLFNRLARK